MTAAIREYLLTNKDDEYREFTARLIPDINKENIIGVRMPTLKKLAKELSCHDHTADFLASLPHKYLEENTLHGLIIAGMRDFDRLISELEKFLPYVDNWSTCDSLRPVIFKTNREKLYPNVIKWIKADKPYTVRFGIEMLMLHYLEEGFDSEQLEIVASVESEHYYVKMMIAWYFATALAYRYDSTVTYLEDGLLDTWVHNKAISKALESFRLNDEKKTYLRTLRHKK